MARRIVMTAGLREETRLDEWRKALEWLPLAVLTIAAIGMAAAMSPWASMWTLAVAIFAGFKWWSWWRAVSNGVATTMARSLSYLFLWPGMDAREFLDVRKIAGRPSATAWTWAIGKTAFGAVLIWGCVRFAPAGLIAGWTGMVGLMFLLHFGFFDALALFWQRQGIRAQPLMRCPALADSLGDFWGRRWNSAFCHLSFDLMFRPLSRRAGMAGGVFLTFLLSGLIHDLVISFPVGGGYGLPTSYFAIQGAGVLAERSKLGMRLGRGHPVVRRLLAMVIVIAPLGLLFPPLFVGRVILPFLKAIGAVQ